MNMYFNNYYGVFTRLIETYWFLGLAVTIIVVIANWKTLEKAGQAGWIQFIPIYNHYIEFKIYWKAKYYWISIFAPFIIITALVFGALSNNDLITLLTYLAVLAFAIYISLFMIILQYKKAKCFGQGFAFTIGLLIMNPLFRCIIAFSKNMVYKKVA